MAEGTYLICTKPCDLVDDYHPATRALARQLAEGKYHNRRLDDDCQGRVDQTLQVDIVCKQCQNKADGIKPDATDRRHEQPGERSWELYAKEIFAPVTDDDPEEMRSYVWYVEPKDILHPEWFREVNWDESVVDRKHEEPVSPKTQTKTTQEPSSPESESTAAFNRVTRSEKRKREVDGAADAMEFLELIKKKRTKKVGAARK